MRFVEDSMFYDATNPRARKYVWEKCRKNYWDAGIRIFWLDEAEPEYGTYEFKNYRYSLGSNQQIGNIYPQCYARGFYDGMREAGMENPVNLLRCAWAGSQRYGALVWSGDIMSRWEDFRRQICAGLSMGAAGIPWWTTDIGGFHDGWPEKPEFRELLIRWFQWGCYCPVMRLHGDRKPVERVFRKDGTEVLPSGSDNEIWSFGEEATPILEKYLRRRELLRPYLRQLMHQAHTDGTPLLRAMAYEFPQEESCANLTDQYMFGDQYLVAPILHPDTFERNVYLPSGRWMDIRDEKVYEGGMTISAKAPLDSIPVFRKV
jgi:alpha-D-xyloside xylohydrolase